MHIAMRTGYVLNNAFPIISITKNPHYCEVFLSLFSFGKLNNEDLLIKNFVSLEGMIIELLKRNNIECL